MVHSPFKGKDDFYCLSYMKLLGEGVERGLKREFFPNYKSNIRMICKHKDLMSAIHFLFESLLNILGS